MTNATEDEIAATTKELMDNPFSAFEAVWRGSKPIVSAGGYVHTFVVPFEEEQAAIKALGGPWEPDDERRVAIVRLKNHVGRE